MNSKQRPHSASEFDDDSGDRSRRVERLVSRYVDQLVSGETLDFDRIIIEHPDVGEEIVAYLRSFVEIGGEADDDPPLGTLGDYTLRREIGRGGMGVVYEAWQGSVEREVALKVLPVGLAVDERAFQRFLREARTAAKLSHPNIVAVHAMGVEGQTPYFAMELVDGETLAELLARIAELPSGADTAFGPKDELAFFAALAGAFAAVADGLEHAHVLGVVHRDVKPSNLILDRNGTADRAPSIRILDFGLATLEGQESLTRSGDIVGTPLYMSPEQARRARVEVDHRTDIYSLGATLYQSLVGRPPFRGKDHGDTLSQIVERDPIALRRLSPRIPADLETVVLKCLSKEPRNRYGTAEALGQDLRRASRGDPVEARPPSNWERLARRAVRHRRVLAVAAGFLALLVAVVGLEFGRRKADMRSRVAEQRRVEATYRPAVLAVVRKIHAGPLALRVAAGESKSLIRFDDLQIPLVTAGEFLRAGGRGADTIEDAVSELETIARILPEKRDAHYHLARAYRLLGRDEDARDAARRALVRDPNFLPARVLAWQLDGGKERDAAMAAWRDLAPDGWPRSWLDAWASEPRWQHLEQITAATGALIALEKKGALEKEGDEPYVGCFVEAYLNRGVARLANRDFVGAQRDFVRVADRTPGLEPLLLLAKAYHVGHREDAADRIFDEIWQGALSLGEQDVAALWIATVCYRLGDAQRALHWADRLSAVLPLRDRLRCRFLTRLDRIEEAIAAGRRAVVQGQDDKLTHIALVMALNASIHSGPGPPKRFRIFESLFFASQAVRLAPDDPIAQRILEGARERANRQLVHILRRSAMTTKGWPRAFCALTLSVFFPAIGSAQEGFWSDVERWGNPPNNGSWAMSPCVTEDGLTLIFQADSNSRPGGQGSRDLWIAERGEVGAPWGAVRNLTVLNSNVNEGQGSLSLDESRLYFKSGPQNFGDIFVASWSNGTFSAPELLPEPVSTGASEAFPVISPDDLELVFMRDNVIHLATRPDPNAPFDSVVRLDNLDLPGGQEWPSSLSTDGRVLFFTHTDNETFGYIYTATRTAPGEPFMSPVRLDVPLPDRGLFHPYVSRDWPAAGSRLRFVGCLPCEIYEATWHPDCNDNGVDDAEEELSDADGNGVPDECETRPEPRFVRGEANDSDAVDISDAISVLEWLFLGGPAPGCIAAANTNGDKAVDIADPVYLLSYLFIGGPKPALPFPECGPGNARDYEDIGCLSPTPGCE